MPHEAQCYWSIEIVTRGIYTDRVDVEYRCRIFVSVFVRRISTAEYGCTVSYPTGLYVRFIWVGKDFLQSWVALVWAGGNDPGASADLSIFP